MVREKIAIPTNDANGLTGTRSEHFGHCRFFTFVDIDDGAIVNVHAVSNEPHGPGGCQAVVGFLKDNNVDTVVAAGMGGGPYGKLNKSGIAVLFADDKIYPDVQSVIDGLQNMSLRPFQSRNLCKGEGNCHQHGSHE